MDKVDFLFPKQQKVVENEAVYLQLEVVRHQLKIYASLARALVKRGAKGFSAVHRLLYTE